MPEVEHKGAKFLKSSKNKREEKLQEQIKVSQHWQCLLPGCLKIIHYFKPVPSTALTGKFQAFRRVIQFPNATFCLRNATSCSADGPVQMPPARKAYYGTCNLRFSSRSHRTSVVRKTRKSRRHIPPAASAWQRFARKS